MSYWVSRSFPRFQSSTHSITRTAALFAVLLILASAPALAQAQASAQVRPEFRIAARSLVTTSVDRARTIPTIGAVGGVIANLPDLGEVPANTAIEHIQLLLRRPDERQAAFDAQVEALYVKGGASFHKWLTPDVVGSEFGPSDSDLQTLKSYLQSEGFSVSHIGKSGLYIDFTGTAAQVKASFGASIHNIQMNNGDIKYSAVTEATIPEALAPLVVGFVSLSNIPTAHPMKVAKTAPAPVVTPRPGDATPQDTVSSTNYAVGPQDFYTIYNETPLLAAATPTNGAGVTIALLEESAINTADVTTFRTMFKVVPNTPVSLVVDTGYGANTCTAPAKVSGEEGEAVLDIEWAGAVAPNAKLLFMQCATGAILGVFYSAEAVIDNNLADIMSLSYGQYETYSTTEDNLAAQLWEQAASQGETVVVSTGDSGAAAEDGNYGDTYAKYGTTASSFSSTAWNVAAGGTDFIDEFNTLIGDTAYGLPKYWNTTTSTAANGYSSALSYVPEMTWNDSCGSSVYSYYYYGAAEANPATFCGAGTASKNIAAGGSSISKLHARPVWQTGTVFGLPTTTAVPNRMAPDVSLFASNGFWEHSLPSYESDLATPLGYAGGTSFVAPQLAGVFALIQQSTGERLGQPNYVLYGMAGKAFGTTSYTANSCNSSGSANNGLTASPASASSPSGGCVFYDITAGTTSVVCLATDPNCYYVSGKTYGILSSGTSGSTISGTVTGAEAYVTGSGWDQATGIGSFNIANLVANWQNATSGQTYTPTVVVTSPTATVTYGSTAAITYTATVSGSGSFPTGSVTFTGAPQTTSTLGTDVLVPSSGCSATSTCTLAATQTFTPGTTAPGTYTITGTYSAVNENYLTGAFGTKTLTINPNPSTITFTIASPQHTLAPTVPLTASSNGTGAFTFIVISGPATITGPTLTITGAGTVVVQVSEAADATYSATTKQVTFTVLAGSIWAGNQSGNLAVFDLLGNAITSASGFTGGGTGPIPTPTATAFDSTGNFWVASSAGVSTFAYTGAPLTTAAYTSAGISNPLALVIDGVGTVWTANGNASFSALSNAGAALSPSTGYTGNVGTPGGIAIDLSGNLWIANKTDNSVTEILGAAAPVAPTSTGLANGTTGVRP